MRIIVIGDIHGRTSWRNIVANEQFDKCIFVGDYFDSYEDINIEAQAHNFENIMKCARCDSRFIPLIGNHEYHYFYAVEEKYSRYQYLNSKVIGEFILKYIEYLKISFQYDKFLITHAGVTKSWINNTPFRTNGNEYDLNKDGILKNLEYFKYYRNDMSGCGNSIHQGPLWIRPQALISDGVDGVIQIVGHTQLDNIKNVGDCFYFIDTLGTSNEYLIIEDGTVKIGKV